MFDIIYNQLQVLKWKSLEDAVAVAVDDHDEPTRANMCGVQKLVSISVAEFFPTKLQLLPLLLLHHYHHTREHTHNNIHLW